MSAWKTTLIAALVAVCLIPVTGLGTVYYSKEEAFALAFGEGATVEPVPVFLSDAQVTEIERLAKVKVDSQLFNFHVGKRGDTVLGYAAIESHVVRTQPETLLVVLSPQGELVRLEVLAFHEPPEYQPSVRWMERLYRRSIPDLFLNQGIDGIAGATLSSRASLDGARKVMAIYRLAVHEEERLMRFFVTGEQNRQSLINTIVLLFLGYIALLWVSNGMMYFHKMGLNPESVVEYYLGSEERFTQPKSYQSLLEVTHFHLFSMGLLVLTLSHLLLFTPLASRIKIWLAGLTYLSAIADEAAGWLVRFVHPTYAWFKIGAFVTLEFSLLALLLLVSISLVVQRMMLQKQDRTRQAAPAGSVEHA